MLKVCFVAADTDQDGLIHESEMQQLLHLLGFTWLKDEQIKGIFDRADVKLDHYIDMHEFVKEAPTTLSTNLMKLAKQNVKKMGLLA